MKIDELLSLATARPPNWENAPGGVPVLTQQDVAQALAYIHHDGAALLLRVKFADQQTYIPQLDDELHIAITNLWKHKKWEKGKNGFLRDMGRMALIEHIGTRICLRCGGWCHDIEHGKVIKCRSCRGTGRKKPSESGRAHQMAVSRDIWRHKWSDKYHYIQAILDEWESLGIGRATSKLRG
jgi:hypothetical protein